MAAASFTVFHHQGYSFFDSPNQARLAQQDVAERVGVEVPVLRSSYVPMLSRPKAAADFIANCCGLVQRLTAARTIPRLQRQQRKRHPLECRSGEREICG
jgi:hypothetical protein